MVTERPPQGRKEANKKKSQRTNNFKIQALSNNYMLEGLEEDVIEMDDDELEGRTDKDSNRTELLDRRQSDPRELANNKNPLKSVPTDKFYLELEKKFAIQNKEIYEKREQERLRQEFEWQLKQKQKEELKYQISTPKTALNAHKFLRKIFLFVHGLNAGFQFWLLIIIFFLNYAQFTYKSNLYTNNPNLLDISLLMIFLENLTMPMHSLSYFFLALCIVDSIDRSN